MNEINEMKSKCWKSVGSEVEKLEEEDVTFRDHNHTTHDVERERAINMAAYMHLFA